MPRRPKKQSIKKQLRMSIDSFEWERSRDVEAKLILGNNDSNWQKLGEIGRFLWNVRGIKNDSLTVLHKECYDTKDSSITVSFKIKILSSLGANPRRLIDFGEEIDHLNDVKLIVEGKTIAVSKNYLAMHSPYLNSLFYGKLAENEKEEIDLADVKYEDVIQILKIIYPTHCKVDASNVEGVLLLSDVWDISIVRRKCDKFLANDVVKPNSTDVQKVLYASRYALPMLQHALLTAFDKKRMIEVMDSAEYKEEYNDSDRVYLLKRFKNL